MRGQILGVGGMPAGDPERASVECKLSELFSERTSTPANFGIPYTGGRMYM